MNVIFVQIMNINNKAKNNKQDYLNILRKIDSIKNLQTTFDIEYMDKNTKIAAGGQIAEKNSIIVNNIKNPTKIIGISDGKGGLLDVDFENQKKKKINNWFINKIIN